MPPAADWSRAFAFGPSDYASGIDPISRVACRITLRFRDRSARGVEFVPSLDRPASGFILWHEGKHYLVTAWHCLSGRNSFSDRTLDTRTQACPSHVVIDRSHLGLGVSAPFPLHGEDGRSLWLEHPDRKRQVADIAALPIPDFPEDAPALFRPGFAEPRQQDGERPLVCLPGDDAFLVGYPRALGNGGWPVWKRASLATQPDHPMQLRRHDTPLRAVLVDGAFMDGLSGALAVWRVDSRRPALAQGKTKEMLWGNLGGGPFWYRVVGVYSGRVHNSGPASASDEAGPVAGDLAALEQARLGLVWTTDLLAEVMTRGVTGTVIDD